ncbi:MULTISPECIES: ABC-type transport auxiliary lipoprotein family protein [unclassified Maridesulfovibrio]|uniref:ABC-type transport auxiliary lipoprotein family protein n=1 Tax=unclassified Maridesulfovibrio TaxID=2794999 RepID=UPI003B41063B
MKEYKYNRTWLCKIAVMLVLVALCAAAGCVKLERPSLDRKYYTLDVVRGDKQKNDIKAVKNLIVRRIKISPRYEDRDLVYKVGENTFEADYYNSFFIPPAALITQDLRLWMGESGVFANVLGTESLGTGELLLEGVVNSIYGDYSGPEPKAVIKMQFILLNNSNPDLPIVYSRDFSRNVVIGSRGPAALVKAMNKGLTYIFGELEKDLAATVRANHFDSAKGYSQEK